MTPPACPRCGYDQSGAVASWDRNEPACCPLEGRCTECGLEFLWRDVLSPGFVRELGLIEHAQRRRAQAAARTAGCVLWPRALWGRLRMEMPVGWLPLVVFSLVCTSAVGGALYAAVMLGSAGLSRLDRFADPPYPWPGWSDQFEVQRFTRDPSEVWWRYEAPQPWTVIWVLAALLMPLTMLLLPRTLRRAGVRPRHLARVWLYGMPWLAVVLCAPVLVLNASDVAICVDRRWHGAGYWLNGWGLWLSRHFDVVGLAFAALWLWVWWSSAARRYLRLPRAYAIGAAMTILAMLGAVAVIGLAPGGLRWLMWDV